MTDLRDRYLKLSEALISLDPASFLCRFRKSSLKRLDLIIPEDCYDFNIRFTTTFRYTDFSPQHTEKFIIPTLSKSLAGSEMRSAMLSNEEIGRALLYYMWIANLIPVAAVKMISDIKLASLQLRNMPNPGATYEAMSSLNKIQLIFNSLPEPNRRLACSLLMSGTGKNSKFVNRSPIEMTDQSEKVEAALLLLGQLTLTQLEARSNSQGKKNRGRPKSAENELFDMLAGAIMDYWTEYFPYPVSLGEKAVMRRLTNAAVSLAPMEIHCTTTKIDETRPSPKLLSISITPEFLSKALFNALRRMKGRGAAIDVS